MKYNQIKKTHLIEAYRTLKEKFGRPPQNQEFRVHCYSWYHIKKHFGSWPKFLSSMKEMAYSDPRRYTIADLEAAYRRLKRKHKVVTVMLYTREAYNKRILNHFFPAPAWQNFLTGIGERPARRQVGSVEGFKKAFFDLERKLGRQPSCNEYSAHCYNVNSLRTYFKNPIWRNFLKSFGRSPLIHNPSRLTGRYPKPGSTQAERQRRRSLVLLRNRK